MRKAFFTYRCWEDERSSDAILWHHTRQIVEVVRELEDEKEVDVAEVGRMYEVIFADGLKYQVFEDELRFDNIWEMTQAEYISSMKGKRIKHSYYNRLGQLMADHRIEVETAAQLGWPVPENVLKDYPEIKRKYNRSNLQNLTGLQGLTKSEECATMLGDKNVTFN